MPRSHSPLQSEMVQGTLDMLILQTLVVGPAHGQTIAHAIERGSEEVLQVETRLPLPRIAPPAEPGLDRLLLGNLREQPESEVLSAHARRQETTVGANVPLGAVGKGNRPDPESGPRGTVMNWRRFLNRDAADAEQREELEFYLDVTAEEYIARGMEPAAARD